MYCKEVLVSDPRSANIWVTLSHKNTCYNLNLWTMQIGKLHGLSTGAFSGCFLPFSESCGSRMLEKRQCSGRAEAPRIQWHWAPQNLQKPAETSHSFSWQLPDYAFPCSGSCLPTCLPWFSKQASVGCARTSHHPLYFKQVTSDQLGSRRCCFSRAVYFCLDSYMCVLCGILKTTVSSAFCRGIEQIIWTYLCHGSLVRATERFIQLGCCSSRKCKKILKFTEVVFPLPKRGCFCRNPNIW